MDIFHHEYFDRSPGQSCASATNDLPRLEMAWAEIIVCLLTLRFVRIGKHVRFPEIVACAVGGEF